MNTEPLLTDASFYYFPFCGTTASPFADQLHRWNLWKPQYTNDHNDLNRKNIPCNKEHSHRTEEYFRDSSSGA